jgi:hypothetical protein
MASIVQEHVGGAQTKEHINVVGISGRLGSGKSYAAGYLKELGYEEIEMSCFLKQIGKVFKFSDRQLYGSQKEKAGIFSKIFGCSGREFMQKTGTEFGLEMLPKLFPNMASPFVWNELVKAEIAEKIAEGHTKFVISGIRRQHEVDMVVNHFGGTVIRIESSKKSEFSSDHKSEQLVKSLKQVTRVRNNFDESFLVDVCKALELRPIENTSAEKSQSLDVFDVSGSDVFDMALNISSGLDGLEIV